MIFNRSKPHFFFFVLTLILTSSLVLANNYESVEKTILDIEKTHDVNCQFISASVSICVGPLPLGSCFYNNKFTCTDFAEKTFDVKLKIRNSFDQRTRDRKEVVVKVKYE